MVFKGQTVDSEMLVTLAACTQWVIGLGTFYFSFFFFFLELPTVGGGVASVTNWSLLSNRERRLLNQPIHIFIRAEERLYSKYTHHRQNKASDDQITSCHLLHLARRSTKVLHTDCGRVEY